MKKLLPKLSYANVVSTICLVLLLGGGAAFAANQLGKNTVGTKQLKKNSVTKAKIKKNAVTAAKIKENAVTAAKIQNGAVDGAKVKDGSLTGGDVDPTTMPFSRVVAKLRGSTTVEAPTSDFAPYPLDNATYTQAANEDDRYVAAVDVTFQPSCEGPTRQASAFLLIDTNPAAPSEFDLVGNGSVEAGGPGTVTKRIEIGGIGTRFEPGTAKQHTLSLFVASDCTTGSGVFATFGGVDVIGTTS